MTLVSKRLGALIARIEPYQTTGAELGPEAIRTIAKALRKAAYDAETLELAFRRVKGERDELLAIAHEVDLFGLAEADAKRREQAEQLRRSPRPHNVVRFPPRRPLYVPASPGGAA